MLSSTVDICKNEPAPWHSCYVFFSHSVSLLDQLLYETAPLTFTSPPPLCQVCTGLHHHVYWGWSMLARMRLHSAPPPPHLHHWCPALRVPLWKTRQCSQGCYVRCIFISIIPSPATAASSSYWKASIFHKLPSALIGLPYKLLPSSILVSCKTAARQSHARLIYHPGAHSFPSAQLGLPLQLSPSTILLTVIRSLKISSEKSRQAVSSSCKSVFWLGSWLSAVPLEDDSVDEDRRDGPRGAAGETEDCRPKHRWVKTTYSTPAPWSLHC